MERASKYLETSFLLGRGFTSPGDFNVQLERWLARANQRHHRRLECRPIDRWQADRAAMVALPPLTPAAATSGWTSSLRLPRDHYVRLDANDYSVHPSAVGRRVVISADLEQVTVTLAGTQGGSQNVVDIARHDRCWARHQTITDPEHARAAAAMRHARRERSTLPSTSPAAIEVAGRDLADYDRIFDLDDRPATSAV